MLYYYIRDYGKRKEHFEKFFKVTWFNETNRFYN
jgi:hypothetical protein